MGAAGWLLIVSKRAWIRQWFTVSGRSSLYLEMIASRVRLRMMRRRRGRDGSGSRWWRWISSWIAVQTGTFYIRIPVHFRPWYLQRPRVQAMRGRGERFHGRDFQKPWRVERIHQLSQP